MSKLSNTETGQGFTHVTKIDLDSYNSVSGNANQTVRLFSGDNARLRAATIYATDAITCGGNTVSVKVGDSAAPANIIASTTISGLGADYGEVAVADIDTFTTTGAGDFDGPLGSPAFAIDTNFDIKNGAAVDCAIGGYIYTLAADQSFDTGTSRVIAADKWGYVLLSVDDDGTTQADWGATDYDTEAEAKAAAVLAPGDVQGGDVLIGYATVKTGSGVTWTAGTDALQGGTGGTPSADTNYYNYSHAYAMLIAKFDALVTNGTTITNGKAITSYVDLTLSLDTGDWSDNNGASFYVLLDIADTPAVV
jgi:hypothetical protein